MTGPLEKDYTRRSLEEQMPELHDVRSGLKGYGIVDGPDGMIIEVTQSNAYAVAALMGHAYARRYPDLFPGFDPQQTPLPSESEVNDSIGGSFGSINEWKY